VTTHPVLDGRSASLSGQLRPEHVIVDRVSCSTQVFATLRPDGAVHIRHGFDSSRLDDDLAELLADALAPITDDHRIFQSAFVWIVCTSDRDPAQAWRRFYENSIARIEDLAGGGYAEVHRTALTLLVGHRSVLDLGCSFGFLALFLARRRVRTVAADTDAGAVRLVAEMSEALHAPLAVVRCTPEGVPLPARSVEAVALLHVLEHTDRATGDTSFLRPCASPSGGSLSQCPTKLVRLRCSATCGRCAPRIWRASATGQDGTIASIPITVDGSSSTGLYRSRARWDGVSCGLIR